jgi:hypothetical protein
MSPNARTLTPPGVVIVALSATQRPCFAPIPPGAQR